MRLIPFLIFLTTIRAPLFALEDSTEGRFCLRLRTDYGFIIAHRPALRPLQEDHVKGIELSFGIPLKGDREWHRDFHYPEKGITVAFFDLGTPRLGKGLVVYPYIDFPLGKKDNVLHFRYGIGLGYVEKVFDPRDNIKNAAVGAHYNGVIHFDLHYDVKMGRRDFIELGAGITHYSNGSFKLPNLGINIATASLAYSRHFGKPSQRITGSVQSTPDAPELDMHIAGSMKKIYPPLGRQYYAGVLSFLRLQSIGRKSKWGVGAELFFDNSLSARIDRISENSSKAEDDFRPGIYLAYQVNAGDLGLMFNMGFYPYTKWKEDGSIYHRICLRYYFEKIFLCTNLKTHYARADFIEIGLGYRFRSKNSGA
jgi:hypothetical protein